MRKSIWMVLLLAVIMFWAAGVSFAQLRSTDVPNIVCNHPCSDDSQCSGECPSCLVFPGEPSNSGKCSDTF